MTLQQLTYIVALDDHRHFVKAAESCMVAQPTLTLQVKKLEEEIGVVLFDRSSQPLRPTPMGEKFIQRSRAILREVKELKEMVNSDKDELEGTYSVGVIPTLAPYLLPRFVKKFCDDHPGIRLEIKEMQSVDILLGLKSNLIISVLWRPLLTILPLRRFICLMSRSWFMQARDIICSKKIW
jgi:LysR family hydrogen peroxide-inducible transcriptional activator